VLTPYDQLSLVSFRGVGIPRAPWTEHSRVARCAVQDPPLLERSLAVFARVLGESWDSGLGLAWMP